MFKKILVVFIALAVTAFMSGCSTLADARSAKGTGPAREYSASVDEVWKAMPTVLAELSLPLVGDNKAEGYILAQRGMTVFSNGENVAIFVESVNGVTRTRVEVVSKKSMALNVFAPDWSKEILDKLGERLKKI
jgi:uncharacterized protein YceK